MCESRTTAWYLLGCLPSGLQHWFGVLLVSGNQQLWVTTEGVLSFIDHLHDTSLRYMRVFVLNKSQMTALIAFVI